MLDHSWSLCSVCLRKRFLRLITPEWSRCNFGEVVTRKVLGYHEIFHVDQPRYEIRTELVLHTITPNHGDTLFQRARVDLTSSNLCVALKIGLDVHCDALDELFMSYGMERLRGGTVGIELDVNAVPLQHP